MELNLVIEQDNINFQDDSGVKLAILQYEETDTKLIVHSIHVDEILRGQGVAGKLMVEIDKLSENKAKTIKPICSYAQKWLEKNKC